MTAPSPAKSRKKGIVKALGLVLFVALGIYIVRYTPAGDYLKPEILGELLRTAGFWAPLVFVFIYAAAVCLFVPGSLVTALGAVLFGPYQGFLYVWVGAMIGASAAFWIGRTLGRDLAASLVGDRLRRYDDAIERNGFATVLYLRLIYFPFTVMNFGMGLTKVRFWDYLAATGLGIPVGTFILTFFFGTLKEVWASGDWSQLLSGKVFFSVALFVLSLFIPKIVRKLKRDKEGDQ